MRPTLILIAVASSFMTVAAASAATVVTDVSPLPTTTTWGTLPGENSGGGAAVVSTTAARSGNGSLELSGGRTRTQMGVQYGGAAGATNLGELSAVTGLSFDWRIAADSISGYNADYTPALRLLIQDGNQRSELIWEGVYNGTYGNTARDTWYSSSFGDNFYQNIAGSGVTLSGGNQVNQSLSSWIGSGYSSSAFVSGISVGAGSGALTTYHAFTDNVNFSTTSGTTSFNFEVAGVPEPATWAMMIFGFGMVGGTMRRRKSKITTNVAYA